MFTRDLGRTTIQGKYATYPETSINGLANQGSPPSIELLEQRKKKSIRSKIKFLPHQYTAHNCLKQSCRSPAEEHLCLQAHVHKTRVRTSKSWLGRPWSRLLTNVLMFSSLCSSKSNEMQKTRLIHLKHEKYKNHTIQRKLVRGGVFQQQKGRQYKLLSNLFKAEHQHYPMFDISMFHQSSFSF